MKEQVLRKAIRKEIRKSINERSYLDRARSSVNTRLGRVSKLGGVKQLKRALALGSPDQRAAGILAVVKELVSGDDRVLQKLKFRLQQKSVRGAMSATDEV
tara:strand:+ start:187 stop:489 length:303 start_codon:yes stop_codon:yes gene_type:complete